MAYQKKKIRKEPQTNKKSNKQIKVPTFKEIKQRLSHCTMCGAKIGECKHPEICKLFVFGSIKGLIKYLKFDEKCFGTEKFYDEYFRVQVELNHFYNDLKWSTIMLAEHYHHNDPCNFVKIIKKFIQRRSFKEANYIAWANGRLEVQKVSTYPYKNRLAYYLERQRSVL